MNDIRAQVAYLHGLAEGLDLNNASAEGRVLGSVIDVLGHLADAMMEMHDTQEEMSGYVEDLDYDLGALEEAVYGEAEDDGEVRWVSEEDEDDDAITFSASPERDEVEAWTGERPE